MTKFELIDKDLSERIPRCFETSTLSWLYITNDITIRRDKGLIIFTVYRAEIKNIKVDIGLTNRELKTLFNKHFKRQSEDVITNMYKQMEKRHD